MSSIKENACSATATESASAAAAKVSISVPISSARNPVAPSSNDTSISQQFKALGVAGGRVGGGTSTLLTTTQTSGTMTAQSDAASTGSKRLIRKFTMIDPKKLQQAGLDRKIAEVLGRKKLMAAVNNLPGAQAVPSAAIKCNTTTTTTSTISTATPVTTTAACVNVTAVSNPPKSSKTLVPPKITITTPGESPTEIKRDFGDMEKAMRLAHAKHMLNKKLLMKKSDQSIQKAPLQILTSSSTLTTKLQNATSSSSLVCVSTAATLAGSTSSAATLAGTISSAAPYAALTTAKSSKATFIDHPKLPTKPKGIQSTQPTNLKKPSPNKTPQEIARVLDFDASSKSSNFLNDNTKPKGPPRVLNYDLKPSKNPKQRQQTIKVSPVNVKKTAEHPQTQQKYENAYASFLQAHVNKYGGSKIENIARHYDYIPKASIRSKPLHNENNKAPCFMGQRSMSSQQQQNQQQLPTGFPEVSPLKHPFPVAGVPHETPLPTIDTVLPFRKPHTAHTAPTATSTTAATASIKVKSCGSYIPSLPSEENIFEKTYFPTDESASTSSQKLQSQQSLTGRNLIVLENKVLSQDEKIDLTALGLGQPNLEASDATLTFMSKTTPAAANLPVAIKEEHVEEFIKLPCANVKVKREPKKLLLSADMLKMPPEKIAAMAKIIKSQTSEGFKKQSGTIIQMPSVNKNESLIEETMRVSNLCDNTKKEIPLLPSSSVVVMPQKRSVSMEGLASNRASALDVEAAHPTAQKKTLLTKSRAVKQQNEKALPIKITNVKTKSSQSSVFMAPPKNKVVIVNKAPMPTKSTSTMIKDNAQIKNLEESCHASHIFSPSISSSSLVTTNKSASVIFEEIEDDVEMSAVDFIASLTSANPITEETTMELSPEELNLNASFAMNLSPIRIPFSLQRDTSFKHTFSRPSSETDTNILKRSDILEEMVPTNSNCDIQIGNIVTIHEGNVFKTVISGNKSENIIELKQMDNKAKEEDMLEKQEKKENVISETQENVQAELKTTGNLCNYPVDMDIEEPYQNEVVSRKLQPVQTDNPVPGIHVIPVQLSDGELEANQNFDKRQEFIIEKPLDQNEFILKITENDQIKKQEVPNEHVKIKATVENVIDLQANLPSVENTVEKSNINTNIIKQYNDYLEKQSIRNSDNTSDAPKRVSRFKKGKVNLVQRKKSSITKPKNEVNQLVKKSQTLTDESKTQEIRNTIQMRETDEIVPADTVESNEKIIDADAVMKCETAKEVNSCSIQSVAGVAIERSVDLIKSNETQNSPLVETKQLIVEIPKKQNNTAQLLSAPKHNSSIGKEIVQELITNILAVEDRTIDANLVSLIQPKKSADNFLLTPAAVPFKRKNVELKSSANPAVGIKSLLRQMDVGKPGAIEKRSEKSDEVEKTADNLSVDLDKGSEKSSGSCEVTENTTISNDIVSKDSNGTTNKPKNAEILRKPIHTNNADKIADADINNIPDLDLTNSEKMDSKTNTHSEKPETKEEYAELVGNLIKMHEERCNKELGSNIESSDNHLSSVAENNNVISADSNSFVATSENTSSVNRKFENKINYEKNPIESKHQMQSFFDKQNVSTVSSTNTMSDIQEEVFKTMDSKNVMEKRTTKAKKGKNESGQNLTIPSAAAVAEEGTTSGISEERGHTVSTLINVVEVELEEETEKSKPGKGIANNIKSQRFTETHASKVLAAQLEDEHTRSNDTKEKDLKIRKNTRRFSASNTVVTKNVLSSETEITESSPEVSRKSKDKTFKKLLYQTETSKGSKSPILKNTELKDDLSNSKDSNDKHKNINIYEVKKAGMKRQTRLSIATENYEKEQNECRSHATQRVTKSKNAEPISDEKQRYKNNRNKQSKVDELKKGSALEATRSSARNAAAKTKNECPVTAKLKQSSKENLNTVQEDIEFLPLTPRSERATTSSTPQEVAVETTCIDYDDDDDDMFKDESSQEMQPVATRKRLRKTFTCAKRKRNLDTETESETEADNRGDGVDVCPEEFLGFDETSPTNSKMQKSLDMLISATSAEEEESCDEIVNKSVSAKCKTVSPHKASSSKPKPKSKSWLTTDEAVSPSALQFHQIPSSTNVTNATNRNIPLKKRWELTQKTNDDIVVTDDTSPADDDEDDEEAYKKLVRPSLAKRKLNNIDAANTQIIAAKKLKLSPVLQIENLENKQVVIKEEAFIKPKPVATSKTDTSDPNQKVLVEKKSSKKHTRKSREKLNVSRESTIELNEESKRASLICEAASEIVEAEEEFNKPKQLIIDGPNKLVELQSSNVKKQRRTKAKKRSTEIQNNDEHFKNTEAPATTSRSSVTQCKNDSEELLVAMRAEEFQALEEIECNKKRTRRSLNPKIETSFLGSTLTKTLPEVRECKLQKPKSAPECDKIKSKSITDYFHLNDSGIPTSTMEISASTPIKEISSTRATKETFTPTSTISTDAVVYIQKPKRGRKKMINSNTNITTENITASAKDNCPIAEEITFNPRLLLVTNRAQVDTDETLTENQTNATGIAGGPTQCGLCLAYTTRAKWTEHLSKHYGVGWLVGEPQIMVTSRNAVINAILSFFKTTEIKGLTCRMCSRLYRSALGLINHIETCGVVQARVICEYCSKDYTRLSLPIHIRTCSARFQQERSLKLQGDSKDHVPATAEVEVFNNAGRLKRASLMKAESKLKVIGEQLLGPATASNEFDPKEHIKYEAEPDTDRWSKDLEKFGKVFCSFKLCKYTADDLKTMEQHFPSCKFQTKPGYHCLLCKKGTKVYDKESDAIHHVTRKHRTEIDKDFEGESSDCSIKTGDESSDEDCSSGVDSNEENASLNSVDNDTSDIASCKSKCKGRSKSHKISVEINAQKSFHKVYPGRVQNVQELTAKKWKNFINKNFVKESLFTYALPIHNIANLSDDVDLEKLLPRQQTSMKFAFSESRKIESSIGIAEEIKWSELKRFETADAASEHFIFLGAPVKTLVWAPLPSDVPEQYLLINYCLSYTRALNPKICKTLILVYKVMQPQEKKTNKRRQSLPPKTQLHYAFSVPDGPVHCMTFLPSGGYDTEINRLGLLAVGTATSTINIYALPLTINSGDTRDETEKLNIVEIKPALTLSLDLRTEDLSKSVLTATQCTQVCWSEAKEHNHIIAGFLNGFVGIWSICDHQKLNRFMINGVRHFVPMNYFYVGERHIRSLAVHYDTSGPRWLAVAAGARHIYVFDIRCICQPLLLKDETVKNIVRSLDWCPVWESFVVSYCDAIQNFGRQIVAINPVGLVYHSTKIDGMLCAVSQTQYNPLLNILVSGTDNGDIVILNPRELHYDDILPKTQKNCRAVSMMDIKLLNGGNLSKEVTFGYVMHEQNYKEKYGLVFKPIIKINPEQKSTYLSKERIPPRNVEDYMRINSLRCNFNVNASRLTAVGYQNGFLRIINFNRHNYFQ